MTELNPTNQEILERFIESGERLRAVTQDLNTTELDTPSEPGGWTVRQIIHHVADDGDVFSLCIKKAIATPGAAVRFEGFPGNEVWAGGLSFERRAVETSLALIAAHRAAIAALVADFPEAWEHSVQFFNDAGEAAGSFTVGQMVGMLADHLQEHVASIVKARAMDINT